MKTKIEVVANVIVILLAIAIGSVYLKDRLASLDGWDWGAHDRTVVLVLRKGCHFCEDSAPFYQRLVTKQQQDGSSTGIVAVFPDAADAVKEVVQSEGLGVRALAGVPLERLKVSGTPTVLMVDRNGTVLNAWIGMLSPRQELDVMRATACHGSSCRQPA